MTELKQLLEAAHIAQVSARQTFHENTKTWMLSDFETLVFGFRGWFQEVSQLFVVNLEIGHFHRVRTIVLLESREQSLCDARKQALGFHFGGLAENRMALAAARLPVRKDTTMEAVGDAAHHTVSYDIEDLLLRGAVCQHPIETEGCRFGIARDRQVHGVGDPVLHGIDGNALCLARSQLCHIHGSQTHADLDRVVGHNVLKCDTRSG
mmetsp:Transcript_32109/g.85985  ORF Transcript_32109/g.85985 Transcript_32109/m.85985 type:complete len:208 (+) Transcript_32109:48-671(+)